MENFSNCELCLTPKAREEVGSSFNPEVAFPAGYPMLQQGDLIGFRDGLLCVAFRFHEVGDDGVPTMRILLSRLDEDPRYAFHEWLKTQNSK